MQESLKDDSVNIIKTYSPFMAEVVLNGNKPNRNIVFINVSVSILNIEFL